jgi:hypothetical protein
VLIKRAQAQSSEVGIQFLRRMLFVTLMRRKGMDRQRKQLSLTIVMGALALALGACSGPSNQPNAPAGVSGAVTAGATYQNRHAPPAATRAVASPTTVGSLAPQATTSVADSPRGGQGLYLHVLMQKPDFASAFEAMDGSGKLPDWVKKGGTATKSTVVNIDGKDQLVAEACKPHDCPTQKVVLIYNEGNKSMQGVFANDHKPGPEGGISKNTTLTWLGKPNETVKKWLKTRLQAPQKFQH